MPVIRSSQLKITTIWPELVNKRLHTVTIQIQESQFSKNNHGISVSGLLQRHVSYFGYDGRNRKARDQLQFELIMENCGTDLDLDRLTIEIQHDYFIFQPRYIGENQAIFEHGFTIIIHQSDRKPIDFNIGAGSFLPVLVDLILDSGKGLELVKGPVLSGTSSLKPELLRCEVKFAGTQQPPLISGGLQGFFSYRTPQNNRLEAEFEQSFGLYLNIPKIDSSQRFLITGDVMDGHWWFDPAVGKWQLVLKLSYSWRIVHETRLDCLSQTGPTLERKSVKVPILVWEKQLRILKSFRIPAGDFPPHELNLTNPHLNPRLTTQGVLLEIDFLADVYTTNPDGHEWYQCHPVNGTEYIGENWAGESIAGMALKIIESGIQLAGFSFSGEVLNLETLVECRIQLYKNNWLDLYPVPNPNGSILGQVLNEQKTFLLSGSQILQLRAWPVQVKQLTISPINSHSQIRRGWVSVTGDFRLTVTYLDRRRCLREDTFPVFFQESFLWENLQPAFEVQLSCRLAHDSHGFNPTSPFRLNYRFWLYITGESTEKRELPVFIIRDKWLNHSKIEFFTNNTLQNQNGAINGDNHAPMPVFPSTTGHMPLVPVYPGLDLEGEILLHLGKAREIAGGRLSLSQFNCRNLAELLLVEGRLSGEIEYWDQEGFLRREQTGFSFWKCIRGSPGIGMPNRELTPELNRFRFTPLNVSPWRKGRIKIQCVLELNPANSEGDSW